MPAKESQRRTHRTANGKTIDMDMLRKRNELTLAVGNQRVNARGDEIGPGGKIIRKREDVMRDYYTSQEGLVPDEISSGSKKEHIEKRFLEDKNLLTEDTPNRSKKRSKKEEAVAETVDAPTAAEEAEWEEDEDGNFTRK